VLGTAARHHRLQPWPCRDEPRRARDRHDIGQIVRHIADPLRLRRNFYAEFWPAAVREAAAILRRDPGRCSVQRRQFTTRGVRKVAASCAQVTTVLNHAVFTSRGNLPRGYLRKAGNGRRFSQRPHRSPPAGEPCGGHPARDHRGRQRERYVKRDARPLPHRRVSKGQTLSHITTPLDLGRARRQRSGQSSPDRLTAESSHHGPRVGAAPRCALARNPGSSRSQTEEWRRRRYAQVRRAPATSNDVWRRGRSTGGER
jgi:hypothetical protein